MVAIWNTTKFIEELEKKFPNLCDFSKTTCKSLNDMVTITCKLCQQDITKRVENFFRSNSLCPTCKKEIDRRANEKSFIENASQMHNGKYQYDKVKYVSNLTKVTITCPIHGDFQQSPSNHMSKKGCPQCGKINRVDKRRKPQQQFISDLVKIHGTKYDYTMVNYRSNTDRIIIRCQVHGPFEQIAGHHLRGHGCPQCAAESTAHLKRKTTEEFILAARAIHGNLYNYDKVIYVRSDKPVIITCSIHGDFSQRPTGHLFDKNGCPQCGKKKSKGEKATALVLQSLNIDYSEQYSIPQLSNKWYDFYFRYNDHHWLIEFDGEPHFRYVDFFHHGSDEDFQDRREVDVKKTIVALENGYHIIRIDYTQIDNIRSHIDKALNSDINFYYSNEDLYGWIIDRTKDITYPSEVAPTNKTSELQ